MTRKKKGILLVSVLLVICLLTSAVAVVAKKANESVVTVIPVESIYRRATWNHECGWEMWLRLQLRK